MDCTAKGIAMSVIMGGWLHEYPGGIGRIKGVIWGNDGSDET